MILQISKLPPPIGGVTIHVKRLIEKLQNLDEFEVQLLDYSRVKNPYLIIKKIINAKVIHIHLSNKKLRLFIVIILRLFLKKTLITFHGKYDFTDFFDKNSLKFCTKAIILNKYSFEKARNLRSSGIHLIGAFIPPNEKDIKPLNEKTNIKLNKLISDYKKIFSTNASDLVFDSHNREIYMGSEIIKFFIENQQHALVFSSPNDRYYNYLKNKFKELPENILFIKENHDFINVLKKSNALIRATTMDGDSLSVKEALYYNKNVYATDIVDRPDGVICFKDFIDFKYLINTSNMYEKKSNNSIKDSSIEIIELYKKVLKFD